MKLKLLTSLTFLLLANSALAELVITGARLNAPIPGQTVSAAYLEIENTGAEKASIVGVISDSASRVEMHANETKNGMMSMVKLDSVEIKPGESLSFVEGGHHLMVFDPDERTMKSGEFDLIFKLESGAEVETIASVQNLVSN